MCFAPPRRALFRHLHVKKWSKLLVLLHFWLGNVLRATTAGSFSTSQLPKVVWTRCVLHILTWKNLLRATTTCYFWTAQLPKVVQGWCALCILTWKFALRQFFDIWTSKRGPNMVCFVHFLTWTCASRHKGVHFFDPQLPKVVRTWVHFDLEMCFAPQQRAIFRQLNFQKWYERGVLCTFWLGNVLRATTACNLSSLIWPAGSAPAALASLLFDPPEPQIIGKTPWIATCLPFRAPASSFFSLFLLSDLLTSFLLLSDSTDLCFSKCPYCRKFHF